MKTDELDKVNLVDDFHDLIDVMLECWLWSKRKPYHRECMLRLSVTDVKYDWNDLQKDRVW